MRVLVIEDNAVARDELAATLASCGHTCEPAATVDAVAQIEALSGVSAGAMAFATDAAGLSGAAVPCWWTGAAWVTATGAVLTD